MDELRRRVAKERAECLASAGFPQLADAERYRPKAESEVRGMVYWNPLESGPMTTGDAVQYGLLGTGVAFEESVPGEVRSHNERFDAALRGCNQQINERTGADVTARFAAWEDMKARVRAEFVERALPAARPALERQMRCFADAIGLDHTFMDPGDVLDAADVERGRYDRGEPRGVRLDDVEIVEVPRSTYNATSGEQRAAAKFVSCANTTGLRAKLLTAQKPARARVLAEFDQDLKQWEQWAEAAARRVGS